MNIIFKLCRFLGGKLNDNAGRSVGFAKPLAFKQPLNRAYSLDIYLVSLAKDPSLE